MLLLYSTPPAARYEVGLPALGCGWPKHFPDYALIISPGCRK